MIKLYIKYNDNPKDNSELILFKEAANKTLNEVIKDFGLKWPPDELIMKIGKRRWYEFKEMK